MLTNKKVRSIALGFTSFALLFAAACGGQDETTLEQAIDVSIQDLGTAPPAGGCTRPGGWWKSHHSFAVLPTNQIPWPVDETMPICRRTILQWVDSNPVAGDVWHVLARQTIVALLNTRSGASAPAQVVTSLESAKQLLNRGCVVSAADMPLVMPLLTVLTDYNNGVIGPGTCP